MACRHFWNEDVMSPSKQNENVASLSPRSNVLISATSSISKKTDREKEAGAQPGTRPEERQIASDGDAPGSGARYPWRRQPMPPRSPGNVAVTFQRRKILHLPRYTTRRSRKMYSYEVAALHKYCFGFILYTLEHACIFQIRGVIYLMRTMVYFCLQLLKYVFFIVELNIYFF